MRFLRKLIWIFRDKNKIQAQLFLDAFENHAPYDFTNYYKMIELWPEFSGYELSTLYSKWEKEIEKADEKYRILWTKTVSRCIDNDISDNVRQCYNVLVHECLYFGGKIRRDPIT